MFIIYDTRFCVDIARRWRLGYRALDVAGVDEGMMGQGVMYSIFI